MSGANFKTGYKPRCGDYENCFKASGTGGWLHPKVFFQCLNFKSVQNTTDNTNMCGIVRLKGKGNSALRNFIEKLVKKEDLHQHCKEVSDQPCVNVTLPLGKEPPVPNE
jgi:hypothetical protein